MTLLEVLHIEILIWHIKFQLLSEKMVNLKVNKDGNFRTAKITYDMFLDKPTKPRTGLSKDIKKELDYLRDGDMFEPDFDLD